MQFQSQTQKRTRLNANIYVYFLEKIGQAGIISCLALNPRTTTMYAAGSYNRSGLIAIHLNIVLHYIILGEICHSRTTSVKLIVTQLAHC